MLILNSREFPGFHVHLRVYSQSIKDVHSLTIDTLDSHWMTLRAILMTYFYFVFFLHILVIQQGQIGTGVQ